MVGTRAGLRHALRRDTGAHVVIDEPIRRADWWLLPAVDTAVDAPSSNSAGGQLGVSTLLAAAQPDGAIVGSTAVADRAHLTGGDDYGAPLFDDVAFRFTVSLYEGPGLTAERLAEVRRVVESEKPAHTDFAICVIEPRMRVGYQAIVGVDTVVASSPSDRDPPQRAAAGLRLAGALPRARRDAQPRRYDRPPRLAARPHIEERQRDDRNHRRSEETEP